MIRWGILSTARIADRIIDGARLSETAQIVAVGGGGGAGGPPAPPPPPGFSAERYLADGAIADASELEPLVDRVLAANELQVEAYRGGKEGLLGFFVGQVMRETQGKADPRAVNELLREKLKAPA
jgi:hypothetical protein